MFNIVILVGNVATDIDVRASQGGTYVATFRLATSSYAGKAEDGVGDGAARVDQLLQCRGDLIRGEGDGADLDDSVSGRIQTGRL